MLLYGLALELTSRITNRSPTKTLAPVMSGSESKSRLSATAPVVSPPCSPLLVAVVTDVMSPVPVPLDGSANSRAVPPALTVTTCPVVPIAEGVSVNPKNVVAPPLVGV